MRNLILNIHVLFPPLKFYKALLLLILFAGSALAQGKGSSVMIYSYGQQGTDAEAVAHVVRDQIAIGLEKYPCVDQMDDDTLSNLLGWERWKQLLGQEPNDEMLKTVAGAVGARYIIVVKTTNLPNGATYTNVRVLDTETNRMVASRESPPASPKDGVAAADALAKQILQDIAGLFKGQCEAHWTGTITYSHIKQVSKTKTGAGTSAGTHLNATVTESISENLKETAEILLQALTLGNSGDTTMARVVQNYLYHREHITSESGTTPCREPGRNPFPKEVSGEEKEFKNEQGQSTETVSVNISVAQTGNYRIKVYKIQPVQIKGKFERSGNIMGCKPNPFSSSGETQGSGGVGYIDLQGQVDPKNPDILTGRVVEGDLENGQKTWAWNLRLVKPKSKRQTP